MYLCYTYIHLTIYMYCYSSCCLSFVTILYLNGYRYTVYCAVNVGHWDTIYFCFSPWLVQTKFVTKCYSHYFVQLILICEIWIRGDNMATTSMLQGGPWLLLSAARWLPYRTLPSYTTQAGIASNYPRIWTKLEEHLLTVTTRTLCWINRNYFTVWTVTSQLPQIMNDVTVVIFRNQNSMF
jgi:hypothetical protein